MACTGFVRAVFCSTWLADSYQATVSASTWNKPECISQYWLLVVLLTLMAQRYPARRAFISSVHNPANSFSHAGLALLDADHNSIMCLVRDYRKQPEWKVDSTCHCRISQYVVSVYVSKGAENQERCLLSMGPRSAFWYSLICIRCRAGVVRACPYNMCDFGGIFIFIPSPAQHRPPTSDWKVLCYLCYSTYLIWWT